MPKYFITLPQLAPGYFLTPTGNNSPYLSMQQPGAIGFQPCWDFVMDPVNAQAQVSGQVAIPFLMGQIAPDGHTMWIVVAGPTLSQKIDLNEDISNYSSAWYWTFWKSQSDNTRNIVSLEGYNNLDSQPYGTTCMNLPYGDLSQSMGMYDITSENNSNFLVSLVPP